MGSRRFLIAGCVLVAVGLAGWLAAPRRFMVDGVSMGPALLPGDVLRTGPLPVLDRLRRPRRFERWVLTAADGLALKRVVGLPGEEVSIVDGDLVIDGDIVLKSPRLLAEVGLVVPDAVAAASLPAEEGWTWSRPAGEVLDDAAFDAAATRMLASVGDVGLAALVDVRRASATEPAMIRVRVGDTVVARSLTTPGRHAVVAGRLDGRCVVALWTVMPDAGRAAGRSCLPPGAPAAWAVADPVAESAADGDAAPPLAIAIEPDDRVTLVTVGRWRDVAWRPAADGRSSWRLGTGEVFVLGDHPPASTDSRRWGPLRTPALRYRLVTR